MTMETDCQVAKVKREKLEACLTCPLCKELFTDATTISECLHTFCRKCIHEKITEEDLDRCPVCKTYLGCAPLEKLRADNSLQDLRSKIFPYKQVKPVIPEMFPLLPKRKERSLASLGVSTPSALPRKSHLAGRRSKLPPTRKSAPEEPTHPIDIDEPIKEVEDRVQKLSSPETHRKNAENTMQNFVAGESSKEQMPDHNTKNHAEALEVRNHTVAESSEQQMLNRCRKNFVETRAGIAGNENDSKAGPPRAPPRKSHLGGRRSKLPPRGNAALEESTHPPDIEEPVKEVEDCLKNLSSLEIQSKSAENRMQNIIALESSKKHMPDRDTENHAGPLVVWNHTGAESSEQQMLNRCRENYAETRAGISDLWNPLNQLVEAASKEKPHKSSEENIAKPTTFNLFGNKVNLLSVQESGNMLKVPGNESDSMLPSVKDDPKIAGNDYDSIAGPSTSVRPRRSQGAQQKKPAFTEDLNFPPQALVDENSISLDSRSIPIWFKLLASVEQEENERLPQISSRYIRVKDRNLTVSYIKKYLVKKLGLFCEAEVEISLRGQPVLSSMEIHHLVDFWVHTTPLSERREATVGSSGREFVMELKYCRKMQPLITISN